MQTSGYAPTLAPGTPYRRGVKKRILPRDGTPQKDAGAPVFRNDYLTRCFEPLPCASLMRRNYNGKEYELVTRSNYEYLRDSYFRYAQLLGRKAPHDPGRAIGEGISNLYDEMVALVGHKRVNIDYQDDKLFFTLWEGHEWPDWTLYWIPVRFIEKLNPRLRRIAVTFLHGLMNSNGLSVLNDEDDTDMTITWFRDEIDNLDREDAEADLKILHSYEEGKAYRAMQRVATKSYYKNLPRALARYEPANEYEKGLVDLMTEGLEFIGKDKPAIMNFQYDPYAEEEPDYRPMTLGRQVRITYDPDGYFEQMLMEWFNCEQQETYCLTPTTFLELSPDTEEPFRKGDYPERFSRWAEKFTTHVS